MKITTLQIPVENLNIYLKINNGIDICKIPYRQKRQNLPEQPNLYETINNLLIVSEEL